MNNPASAAGCCHRLASTLAGLINGMLLTRLDLPHPFVSTLGMKNVLWGLALVITGSQVHGLSPISGIDGLMWIGGGSLFTTVATASPVSPSSSVLVIVTFIIAHLPDQDRSGPFQIYCVGGNPEAARLSGIHSANVLTFVLHPVRFHGRLWLVSCPSVVPAICNGVNADPAV